MTGYLSEPHHSLSITGGEPLLHAEFLAKWIPEIKKTGLKIFIETNGMLPDHMKRIVSIVDYVSMDFKAPTSTGMSREETKKRHRRFLEVAQETKVYVKFVATSRTTDEELMDAVEILSSVNASIPLILQPVTPFGFETAPVLPSRMIELHAMASRKLDEVRVIPQTHKMMKLL